MSLDIIQKNIIKTLYFIIQGHQTPMSTTKERTVDDYTLVCMIGKGCIGKVYLVRDKSNSKIYAMKVVKKKYLQREGKVQNILTQRNILAEVRNPFVIQIVSSFQNQKKLYFILEYCPGGDLFTLLSLKEIFTEQQAKFYIAQIVLALQYLHQKQIVYRDLRPENILIDKSGYVKVTDFGLAKKAPLKQLQNYSINGIAQYIPPQVLFEQKGSHTVDYWALGLMLYEMTTGMLPFYSENINQFYENIKNKPFEVDEQVKMSKQLRSLLDGLFIKDPTKRLGSNGADQVKKHPWFNGINWQALQQKKYKSPFIPILQSEQDTSYFSNQVTKETLNSYDESYSHSSFNDQDQNVFAQFTYNMEDSNDK